MTPPSRALSSQNHFHSDWLLSSLFILHSFHSDWLFSSPFLLISSTKTGCSQAFLYSTTSTQTGCSQAFLHCTASTNALTPHQSASPRRAAFASQATPQNTPTFAPTSHHIFRIATQHAYSSRPQHSNSATHYHLRTAKAVTCSAKNCDLQASKL